MFAAVRHPDVQALGICPQGALETQRARGWIRVSPWVTEPADLHMPDYAESYVDLDTGTGPQQRVVYVPEIDNGVAVTLAETIDGFTPAKPEKEKDES